MSRLFVCALALSLAAGCTTIDPQTGERVPNRMATGAIIGAVGGAVAGTAAGGDDRRNAIIGAGIGALSGAAVGGYMDRQERALRERLAQSDIQIQRTGEDTLLLTMPGDVTFDFNRTEVKPQFQQSLRDLASGLVDYPSTYVDVIGHTDSVGSDAYNQDLSVRRAQSVANVLIQRGVQPARLVTQGLGESQPVANNETDAGRATNRRVVILLRAVTSAGG